MVFTSLTFSTHSSSKKWRETYNARIPPKGTHLPGKGEKRDAAAYKRAIQL
jgi:hypothetical protein